jgi:hypothetical protein
MSWGTITVGRLVLRETEVADDKVNATTGRRTITITGQESNPPLTTAGVRQRREDIMGVYDRFLQVVFTDKPNMNGYYVISDAGAILTDYQGEVVKVDWNLTLELIGPANAVDLDSRVARVTRVNDFGLTGVAWHAPSASAYAYYTGATNPSGTVSRAGSDGTVTVYLGVPDVNPRWGAALVDYPRGRVRVTVDGAERSPVGLIVDPTSTWTLDNSLVKVAPGSAASFTVSSWGGAAWEDKSWNLLVGADLLAGSEISAVTVLRNDFESATVRTVWTGAAGRNLLDLTLRRGSRFVEGYLQTGAADTLWVLRTTAEAGTAPASAAYVTATANDADGNRYIVGSARTFTANTVTGGLSKAATRTLDFFLGSVVSGSGAATGDAATDLRNQYILTMSETTMGVRR